MSKKPKSTQKRAEKKQNNIFPVPLDVTSKEFQMYFLGKMESFFKESINRDERRCESLESMANTLQDICELLKKGR